MLVQYIIYRRICIDVFGALLLLRMYVQSTALTRFFSSDLFTLLPIARAARRMMREKERKGAREVDELEEEDKLEFGLN